MVGAILAVSARDLLVLEFDVAYPLAERGLAYRDDLFLESPRRVVSATRDILNDIRRFDAFGANTIEVIDEGVRYFTNEFWTSGQRKAHSIQEISYRACFKPQLPEFFIDRLTSPGDTVYDPFMGRGTTPVQASLMGRIPAGNDINPLSVLLARPRLSPPSLPEIERFLKDVPWDQAIAVEDALLAFYHPQTLRQLTILRDHLLRLAPVDEDAPDPVVDWVRMVALNRLTGHSPGFFSVYTLPPNQAVSIDAQRKINQKRGQVPPVRNIAQIILKKSRSLLRDEPTGESRQRILLCGPADDTPTISSASIALTVTSPPFLDIVQYSNDNWLRCWFGGIDVSGVDIAMHRSEAAWSQMVRSVLEEQVRILRPGGHIAFEVGEVRRGRVLLERLVWRAAEGLPLERLGVVVNQQEFTKTANCWGVGNNSKGTNTNRIVIMRKIGE